MTWSVGSGPCSVACCRPDVRCLKGGVRSSGAQDEDRRLHPAGSGEGNIGRVRSLEPLVDASSSGALQDETLWRGLGTRRCDATDAGR